jgi:hypothetical protein
MILSFGGINVFSVVNVQGEKIVRSGEEQTYHITLQTVNPEQFKTPTHYREQYGEWRIEDANGTILSAGKQTKIELGVYDQYVTIQIPYGFKHISLVTDIIEYQFSAVDANSLFLKSEGTIRTEEKLDINIIECAQHSDCNVFGTCLGQFGYCTNNLCEVKAECRQCVANSDCSEFEEAVEGTIYQCINFKCAPFKEPTFVDTFKKTFSEPITQPTRIEPGQPPQSKQATGILTVGVFLMIGVILFIMLRRSGKI